MRQIALSYRRADSSAIAGRIQEHLANHFGSEDVFMDIDAIPFGEDFRDYIDDALRHAVAMVLVIGPKWLGPKRRGIYRIQDATDPVRIEVETAMRLGIRIVPVLVEEATMPQPSDLPDTLAKLPFINAATVDSGRDFRIHMERVIRALEVILDRTRSAAPISPELVQAKSPLARPERLAEVVSDVAVKRTEEIPLVSLVTPVAAVTPDPVMPAAPDRAAIAARVTSAWWVSLVRGVLVLAAGVVQLAFPVTFHRTANWAALANGLALFQVAALIFMIGASKSVGLARIAFAGEIIVIAVGTATQTTLGVGVALLVSFGRAAAEAGAGVALGRYVRAEYTRVVLAGVLMLLTLVTTLALLNDRSSGESLYRAGPLATGIAFVVLALILRSAKNRAPR